MSNVWMGRCDMCGDTRTLHRCGEFVICDSCELVLRGEEE